MQASKTTDKLIVLETILDQTPLDRVKEIDLVWKEVDGIACPFLHVEYYPPNEEPVSEIEKILREDESE